jgi:hypothetical protein
VFFERTGSSNEGGGEVIWEVGERDWGEGVEGGLNLLEGAGAWDALWCDVLF